MLHLRSNSIVTLNGLELVLKDLYQFKRNVDIKNVMQVFCCSLFLEVDSLATFCLEFITDKLAKFDSVLIFAKQMDMLDEVKDLRSEYKFRKLVKSYRKKLERAIFGSILYLITFLTENNVGTPEEVVELNADACVELKNSKVNEEINLDIKDSSENDIFVLANEGTDIISDNQSSSNSPNTKKDLKNICPIVKSISTLEPRLDENSNSSPEIITVINKSDNVNIGNVVGSAGIDRTLPVHVFLAKLPLSWIEKVVCADQLFIRSEFDRYQLLKKILDLRHSTNDSELFIDNLTTAHDEKAIGSAVILI